MNKSISYRLFLIAGALCTIAALAQASQSKHREFSRQKEKELHVILDVSFGSISIERCKEDKIAVIDYDDDEGDSQKLNISYEISGETGILNIRLKESTHFWSDDEDHESRHRYLDLRLSDALPISLEIELGAGKGKIDLTDLQMKDIKISTGASSVTMKCNSPNQIVAEDISIESGVSKFTATELGNLNFRNLKFSGGVGAYKLDFSGDLRQNAEVEIEVGLGSINVYVPKSIPTRLVYDDNWLSSFRLDDDFEKKHSDVFETDDFQDASRRLIIRMEAGLGSVRVHRK